MGNTIKSLFKIVSDTIAPKISTWFISFTKWKPLSDSTTALSFFKQDGTSKILNIDTTNQEIKLLQIGTSATSAATQKSSGILKLEASLWNGSAEIKKTYQIQLRSSTSVNNTSFLEYKIDSLIVSYYDTLAAIHYTNGLSIFNNGLLTYGNGYIRNSANTIGDLSNLNFTNYNGKHVFRISSYQQSNNDITGYSDLLFYGCPAGGSLTELTRLHSDGSLSLLKSATSYLYRSASTSIDTIGDFRTYGNALGFQTEYCTAGNATKGGGTWVTYKGYSAKTSTYNVLFYDGIIDCTSGTFTVTLLTAVGLTGTNGQFTIKNSGAGTITLATTSSQTIDGQLTQTIAPSSSITVQSTGANWIII
jgi:hypothetical protein